MRIAVALQARCSTFAVRMQYDCSPSTVFSSSIFRACHFSNCAAGAALSEWPSVYPWNGRGKRLRNALRSRKPRPIDQRRISSRQRGSLRPMATDSATADAVLVAIAPAMRPGFNAPVLSPSLRFEALEHSKKLRLEPASARVSAHRHYLHAGSDDARWRRQLAQEIGQRLAQESRTQPRSPAPRCYTHAVHCPQCGHHLLSLQELLAESRDSHRVKYRLAFCCLFGFPLGCPLPLAMPLHSGYLEHP